MRSRSLLITLLAVGFASGAGVVGWSVWRSSRADELVEAARARLSASLTEAPELDRVQAGTALSLLERARDLGCDGEEIVGLSHHAAALVDLQKGDLILAEGELTAARHRLGWTPDLRVVAAEIARRRTDLDAARIHVEEALAEAPHHPRALLLSADLALDRDEPRAALEPLGALASAAPDCAAVHNRVGIAWLAAGDPAAAERALRRAIDLDGRDADPWVNLGRVMRRAGEHAEALRAFDRAAELASGRSDAHLGRGLARAALGDVEGAARDFLRAAELAPNDAEPLLALGDLQRDLGRVEDAVATYREALGREDADAASWLKLGNALVLRGEARRAAGAFREAIRRAPELAAAHNGLGAALMAAGDSAEAAAALAQAAALDGADPNPLMNLALLRERSGDRAGAREAWREALERDPGSAIARQRLERL